MSESISKFDIARITLRLHPESSFDFTRIRSLVAAASLPSVPIGLSIGIPIDAVARLVAEREAKSQIEGEEEVQ